MCISGHEYSVLATCCAAFSHFTPLIRPGASSPGAPPYALLHSQLDSIRGAEWRLPPGAEGGARLESRCQRSAGAEHGGAPRPLGPRCRLIGGCFEGTLGDYNEFRSFVPFLLCLLSWLIRCWPTPLIDTYTSVAAHKVGCG